MAGPLAESLGTYLITAHAWFQTAVRDWLQLWLLPSSRLMFMTHDAKAQHSPTAAGKKKTFDDGFPLLVYGTASG